MVKAYWHIDRVIVEERQKRKERAEYFYLVYPKCNALRPELSRIHYRLLLKVKDKQTRLFYMQETADRQPLLRKNFDEPQQG